MINRLKNYIDLTKKICNEPRIIYVSEGKVYTTGDNIYAITWIGNDNLTQKFGLDKCQFKILVDEFEVWLKEYKKVYQPEESYINDAAVYLQTTIGSNIKWEWMCEDQNNLSKILQRESSLKEFTTGKEMVCYHEFTQHELETWITEKPSKFFINAKTNKISFGVPEGKKSEILVAVAPTLLGKVLKSSELSVHLYHNDADDSKVYTLVFAVTNGKFLTKYYTKIITT